MKQNIEDILYNTFVYQYEQLTGLKIHYSVKKQQEIKQSLLVRFNAQLNENDLKIIKSI